MTRMMKDLELDRAQNPEMAARDRWEPSQEEDEDAEDDLEVNIIDRSTFRHALRQSSLLMPLLGEERWPGQYIDVTQMRRRDDEGVSWPRPG